MPMPNVGVPVQAVEARVRRRLRHEGEALRKARFMQGGDLGPYYTVDLHCGNPVRWNCELEHLARDCGALPPWAFVKEE